MLLGLIYLKEILSSGANFKLHIVKIIIQVVRVFKILYSGNNKIFINKKLIEWYKKSGK